ncbi:hypothetical protein OR573_04875 [Halomonas sp. CH40]
MGTVPDFYLVIPRFYGYETIIRKEAQRLNICSKVVTYSRMPFAITKILTFLGLRKNLNLMKLKRIKKGISSIKNKNVYVILVLGHDISSDDIVFLAEAGIKPILYLWDKVSDIDEISLIDMKKYSSIVYSFNPQDCVKYDLDYLPVFSIVPASLERKNIIFNDVFFGAFSQERVGDLNSHICKEASDKLNIIFLSTRSFKTWFKNFRWVLSCLVNGASRKTVFILSPVPFSAKIYYWIAARSARILEHRSLDDSSVSQRYLDSENLGVDFINLVKKQRNDSSQYVSRYEKNINFESWINRILASEK